MKQFCIDMLETNNCGKDCLNCCNDYEIELRKGEKS
jgi:hypothetical protein